jgi:hypothetical protein
VAPDLTPTTPGQGRRSSYLPNERGYIFMDYDFMDYDQANTSAPLRIVTHETSHALGLPARYTQPCCQLMSVG